MSGAIKIGPWGGESGATKDDGPGIQITAIRVHSGEVVDGIRFTYKKDGAGPTRNFTIGGTGGDPSQPINLPDGEYIVSMSGKIVEFRGHLCVSALSFLTNNGNEYGKFGRKEEGFEFTLPIENGKVVSFFGRSGKYVHALGVYVSPVD